MLKMVALAIFYAFVSSVVVVCVILIGWMIVWKLVLSRFEFVQELFLSHYKQEEDAKAARKRAQRLD